MTMAAKFAGRCRECGGQIRVGESIDWEKARGAKHVTCGTTRAAASSTPASRRRINNAVNFGGRTCTWPGCNRPAIMAASVGGACSYHYDDLS